MDARIMKKANNIKNWLPDYIEGKFSNPKFWGHTFTRHVNMTEHYLCQRSASKMGDASSFIGDEDDILQLLKDTMLSEIEIISLYLADDTDDAVWEIEGTLPENIRGVLYSQDISHVWEDGPIECEHFILIISKVHNENNNGFFVFSAYPIQ